MAGFSGFARHRCSLHLGAGCQQWKLQDVSVTQPPLNDTVVKAGIDKQGPYKRILVLTFRQFFPNYLSRPVNCNTTSTVWVIEPFDF